MEFKQKQIMIEDGLGLVQNAGVGQYTQNIYKMCKMLDYEVSMPRKTKIENIKNSLVRRIIYIIWLNSIFLIKLLSSSKIKAVIFTSTIVPFIKIRNIEYISILHDILSTVHPECRTKIQNLHANFATYSALNCAHKIITVSEFSKSEIIKYYHYDESKIYVVNNTFSPKLNLNLTQNNKILTQFNLISNKYILCVALAAKHKNTQMLIDAFELISNKYPDIKLVLVGRKNNCPLKTSNKNVIFTGFVYDEDLSTLYQNAKLYVFPSLYEGFGIPIIDAQKFGIPVICSDIPVFHEVANESVLFSKLTPTDFANSISKIFDNKELYKKIINDGVKNIEKYSLENITKQLGDVLG